MFKLLGNIKGRDRLMAFLCLALVAGQVFFDLKMPDYTKEITLLISMESNFIPDYLMAGLKMLLCALVSAGFTVVVGYLAASIAADFSFNVREQVFSKVSAFGSGEIKKFSTASLITRTTNDITQIQMVIAMGLQMMIKAPIMAGWGIIKIVGKSWQLSALTAFAVVVLLLSILILMLILLPKFKLVQTQVDDVNRVTRENLSGLRVIHAFNAEKYQQNKFEQANDNLTRTQMFTMRGMAFLFPIMIFVQSALSLAIYWVGAKLIDNISVDLSSSMEAAMRSVTERADLLGDVVVFNSYALYIIMSFVMLLAIFMMWPRAQVSANRINEVIDADIAVNEGNLNESAAKEIGTVEFKNVSFRYPDASDDCLKNISFKVERGETIAFIGATGSGKSSLIGLVARLYDATGGEVLVDGVNVKDYTFKALYNKLGYVTQKAILFSDTIKNNIAFGESAYDITEQDIRDAVDIAQAAEFVSNAEGELDSKISQGGTNVSGGQKQRLSIARAIVRKPEILIFDDSFSALDYKTDKALRKRIEKDLKDTTCMIVAQRIGTIRNADKIVVIDNGEAVGIGTHRELMDNCSVYREIALSQLSQSELG